MHYQVYDFTTKHYLKKGALASQWVPFKTDATRFTTREEAQEIIDFYRPFSTNDYRILTVKYKKPICTGHEHRVN